VQSAHLQDQKHTGKIGSAFHDHKSAKNSHFYTGAPYNNKNRNTENTQKAANKCKSQKRREKKETEKTE
jgi:hypothetical protein